MNLIIITRLRGEKEFPDAFGERLEFQCPLGILKVYEGTDIWSQCQTIKDFNVETNYEKLLAEIRAIAPFDRPDQYILLHDKRTVEYLQSNGFTANLALYNSGIILETQEYLWVSDAVKTAAQGKEVGELVQKIVHHYFLLPDLKEAGETLQKRFAFGTDEEPDFERDICRMQRHPSLPHFMEAAQQLRHIFDHHLPEYRKTPQDVQYPAWKRLKEEVHALSL